MQTRNKKSFWLLIGLFSLALTVLRPLPASAHIGSMTKAVDGKVITLDSQPLANSKAEDNGVPKTAHKYSLTISDSKGNNLDYQEATLLFTKEGTEENLPPLKLEKGKESFAGKVTFPSDGLWKITLQLQGDKGPLTVEFSDRISSQPDSAVVLAFLAVLVVLYGGIRYFFKKYGRSDLLNGNPAVNLLRSRLLRKMVLSRFYPGVLRWLTLGIFTLITIWLLAGPELPHQNLGWALTWLLWWALVPLSIFFLGRIWCAICPLAAVGDIVKKIHSLNRKVPRFLTKYGIWIVNFIFLFITWFDNVYGLVEVVRTSGYALLLLVGGVIIISYLYQRRAFCHYVCPLGGLWGNYAVVGSLAVKAQEKDCAGCKTFECYHGTKEIAGCPMNIVPRNLRSARFCNLCANCVKACPRDAVAINLRNPLAELFTLKRPRFDIAFLAVVLVGVVFIQNGVMLNVWREFSLRMQSTTGLSAAAVFNVFFLAAVLVPVLIILALSYLGARGNKEKTLQIFGLTGFALIPFNLATHLAHNLQHLLSEGKLLWLLLPGVAGEDLMANPLAMVILDNPTIQAIQNILILIGGISSIYALSKVFRKNDVNPKGVVWIFSILVLVFMIVSFWVTGQPMALRG